MSGKKEQLYKNDKHKICNTCKYKSKNKGFHHLKCDICDGRKLSDMYEPIPEAEKGDMDLKYRKELFKCISGKILSLIKQAEQRAIRDYMNKILYTLNHFKPVLDRTTIVSIITGEFVVLKDPEKRSQKRKGDKNEQRQREED